MIKFILALMLLSSFCNLQAAIITVNKSGDTRVTNDGGCDLREAILSANFNDLTTFDGCVNGSANTTDIIIINIAGPIQLEDQIEVHSAVSISPPIASSQKVKIIAANGKRIFEVQPFSEDSNDFQMINLHLEGGDAGLSNGGAIRFYRFQTNNLGNIHIGNSIFENNKGVYGGALAFDETYADSITITDSEFINNTAQVGGAISAGRASDGDFKLLKNKFNLNSAVVLDGTSTAGAVFFIDSNEFTYLIQNNQFINNSSEGSVGALNLNGYNAIQRYHLDNNVFFDNQAESYAGALSMGALAYGNMYNSTIAYNSGSRGGGVAYLGGRLDIRFSTIVHNNATEFAQNIYANSGLGSIYSSIVAYPGDGNNCGGSFSSNNSFETGFSAVIDDSSCLRDGAINYTQADPLLSELDAHPSGFNGFTPLVNSPAIDNVDLNHCYNYDNTVMQEDQQGNPRPVDSDSDNQVFCDSGAIEAPVYLDQAAIANDDSPKAILEDDNDVIIDVLANDTDADGGSFIVIAKTNGSHGTVTITNSGQNVSYDSDDNYCGSDTFTYTITGDDSATVSINITCVDDAPIAVNDIVLIAEDSEQITVQVLNNDTDIDDGIMTIDLITQPGHGTVINNNISVSYQPDADYCNDNAVNDVFTYRLNGGSIATVSLQVSCVNDEPIAITDSAIMNEDSNALDIQVLENDTDVDTGENFVDMLTQPSNGQITNEISYVTYTPNANYCGDDNFTYSLNGGSTTTVNVEVRCVNDQPSYVISGDIVANADMLNQSQVSVPNFAGNISYGPSNESNQTGTFEALIQADESDVIENISISENGILSIEFTQNPGVAIIHSSLQDSGGVANGGNDTSETTVFYVTFTDVVYANGFEGMCCQRVEDYIDTVARKYPESIIPIYDMTSHSIEFYGYVLELNQGFPNNPELHHIKQWLKEIQKISDPESMVKFK